MNVEKLITEIEKIAPPKAAAEWDTSGVQCIASECNILKMAVCLDPTLSVIKIAINNGAHFILSHHPLSLKPQFINKNNDYQKIISLLIKNDVWLYAAHTSLDANPDGPVKFLAQRLNLQNLEILDKFFIEHDCLRTSFGYGLVGNLPEPIKPLKLINDLGLILKLDSLILIGELQENKFIKRIAYCPGSGAEFIDKAQNKNCDLFISGDIKYHKALEAKIPVLDVGHHSMEEEMMNTFSKDLQNICNDIKIFFIPSKSPMHTITLNNMGAL